jgi:prepilin-type N-terminal cleavage/methylation domain-containing protein
MGPRFLNTGGAGARADRGFTLVEVMISMAVTITVLLANLYIFNTVQKNLAFGRATTAATNLATDKIADFRGLTVAEIFTAAPTTVAASPLRIRTGFDQRTADGVLFTRAWTVSDVDVDGDANRDLADELVKVSIDVAWSMSGITHKVAMSTFTTGRPQE